MKKLLLGSDRIILDSAFGAAMLSGNLELLVQGTARPTAMGQPLVLQADLETMVWPVVYTTSAYSIPGTGTVRLVANSIPTTATTTAAGASLVLSEPAAIDADFTVATPASMPGSPPSLDTNSSYSGKARMVTRGAAPEAA